MNIYNKGSLINFWLIHADSRQELELWYNDVSEQVWKTPNEVKNSYSDASIIKNNRVVFNVCRNDYRLIVQFNYAKGWGFIKFIGTHRDYDREDAATVNQFSRAKKPKKVIKKDKKK
jgi:mRNA interferase HigB